MLPCSIPGMVNSAMTTTLLIVNRIVLNASREEDTVNVRWDTVHSHYKQKQLQGKTLLMQHTTPSLNPSASIVSNRVRSKVLMTSTAKCCRAIWLP